MSRPPQAAPGAGGAGRRYRCRELAGVQIGTDAELVRAAPGSPALIVPARTLRLARRCATFRTLEEHARDRGRELGLGPGEVGTVLRDLQALAARGLLVSLEELVERCAALRGSEPPPPPIETVGIVTCDRPRALARAVASHREGLRAAGRDAELLVLDDSRDPATGRAIRELLAERAAGPGPRPLYAGREEKARFAAALAAETGVPEELIAFALFGPERSGMTAGANRNALLLATAGRLALSVDDDVLGSLAAAPDAEPGVILTSDRAPGQWWFFADREQALAAGVPRPPDLLGAHQALLGRTPAACLAEHAGAGADLDRAGPALIALLETGRGRVRLTMTGRAGDSAASDPIPLNMSGPSRERLVRSEADYRTACTSREVVRAVTRTTVGDRIVCSTLALGLDNRPGLPPFLPVGRSEDVAFGDLIRACWPDACTGCLPVVVPHVPPGARGFAPGDVWRKAGAYRVAWFLSDRLGPLAGALAGSDPPARMRALGGRLSELAALAPAEFDAVVAADRRMRAAARTRWLETALKNFKGSPEYWAEDVRRHIAVLRETMARDDADLARDLDGSAGDPDAARSLIGRYGELLRAWPDLIEGARRLRARGVGPGQTPG